MVIPYLKGEKSSHFSKEREREMITSLDNYKMDSIVQLVSKAINLLRVKKGQSDSQLTPNSTQLFTV